MRHLTRSEAVNSARGAVSSVTHLHPSGLRTMSAPQAALALFVAAGAQSTSHRGEFAVKVTMASMFLTFTKD